MRGEAAQPEFSPLRPRLPRGMLHAADHSRTARIRHLREKAQGGGYVADDGYPRLRENPKALTSSERSERTPYAWVTRLLRNRVAHYHVAHERRNYGIISAVRKGMK